MTKRWLEIPLHVLFWAATSWFIISTFAIEGKDIQIIKGVETVNIFYSTDITRQLIACIFLSALMAYASVHTITKNNERLKPFLFSVAYLVFGIVLFSLLRNVKIIPPAPAIPYSLVTGIFLFYYASAVTYAVARLWKKTDMLRKQMEVEKKDAELSLLRSQLQPHFLFNVLNSLLSMVDRVKNPEMSKAIIGLSELLRYVVNESSKGLVPVHKEIQFIKNYITLQSLRFEKKELNFKLNVTGEFTNQYCEPGVFIPFIENAFKYGMEPEKESEISAKFDFTEENKIKFSIVNTIYPALSAYEGNGVGIVSAKKRLEMAYPQKHILQYGPDNGLYTVYVEIITDEGNNSR